MQEHRELLLAVWREVSRHLNIEGSTLSVAQLLQEKVPLQRLVVRILEPRNGHVQTVAVGPDPVSASSLGGSTPCSETDKALAEQWYCDGGLVHGWTEASSLPGAAILPGWFPNQSGSHFRLVPKFPFGNLLALQIPFSLSATAVYIHQPSPSTLPPPRGSVGIYRRSTFDRDSSASRLNPTSNQSPRNCLSSITLSGMGRYREQLSQR